MDWKPGDRVKLLLPDKSAFRGRGGAILDRWFAGTVREVDTAGLAPGVRVDLDDEVNGVRECYAAPWELQAA